MLSRIRKAMDEKESGFTLIELLVVMIIIGILAAIAIPVFLNQRRSAFDAGVKSDIRQVATEAESVYTDTQQYPASVGASTGTITLTAGTPIQLSQGNTLVYTRHATEDRYVICGWNPRGKRTATPGFVYRSDLGGFQGPTATCTV